MLWIRNNIGLALAVLLLLIIGVLMVLPVDVPFAIKEPGKILPVKEWVLQKNSSGGITTTLYDHKNGNIEMSSIDSKGANMKFSSNPRHTEMVKQGDTIGFIRQTTSEKTFSESPILSPISGLLSNQLIDSVFLSVRDISQYLVVMPVKLRDKNYVNTGQTIFVKIPGTEDMYEGKMMKVENDFQVIKGNQYMVTIGILNVMTKEIQPGMIARCTIECQPVRMREYIQRTLDLGVNEQ